MERASAWNKIDLCFLLNPGLVSYQQGGFQPVTQLCFHACTVNITVLLLLDNEHRTPSKESDVCSCINSTIAPWGEWDQTMRLHAEGFPGGSGGKASACNVVGPGSIPGLGRSPREGNGNPLLYSCLDNSTNRGAWQATVHGVAKSWTSLSDFTFHLRTDNQ